MLFYYFCNLAMYFMVPSLHHYGLELLVLGPMYGHCKLQDKSLVIQILLCC